jgi:hypothetical protein
MAKAKRKVTAGSAVRRELRSPLTSKQRWTLDRLERLQRSKPKALNLNSTQMHDI